MAAVEEIALGFAVEGLGHKMSLGESEGCTVADCGVNTTVGIASIDALDCCCRIKFLHNKLFYINLLLNNLFVSISKTKCKYTKKNEYANLIV